MLHGLRQTTATNAGKGEDNSRVAGQWVNLKESQELIAAFPFAPGNPLQKEQSIPGPRLWIVGVELERPLELTLRKVEVQIVKQSGAREGAGGLGEVRPQLGRSSARL